jgi:ammonia channel protein AmtB
MSERARLEPLLGFIIVLEIIILPVIFCWAWNLQGGYLRTLGYFDRGGSIMIFYSGALAGIIGSLVLGPRYGLYMKKVDIEKIHGGGKEGRKKPLTALLEGALDDTLDVDDLFLRKVRKLIKKEGADEDFYQINAPMMVLGTFLVVVGWCMLNSCGTGAHSLNSVGGRYSAELAFMNTLMSGSFSAMICFVLKRHIVRGDH